MSDNRWPEDKTSFRVEAKSTNPFSQDGWVAVGAVFEYDTFVQATEEAELQSQVYRELRIVRLVDTVVAAYKDGVVSE